MLNETERVVLAICLDRNEFVPTLLENLDRSYFHGESLAIFEAIADLAQSGMDCRWVTVRDALGPKITPGTWRALADSTRGLHQSGAEAFLTEKIQALKAEYARSKAIAEISSVVRKPVIEEDDIDHLGKIISQAKLVGRPKEEPALATAESEYREHIRRAASQVVTGIPSIDRRIDGFNPGEIATVMARTGVGKTFIALNILNHLAGRTPFRIAFFSLEMPKSAIYERMLEVYFGISRHEAKEKSLDGSLDLARFAEHFQGLSIYDRIYAASEIRKIIEREGFRIVFVDFLHLIRPELQGMNNYQQISRVVADLKQAAKDTGAVIFLLHQLSRQAGSGWTPVEAAHARDSGQVEELSDFIIGAWAPGLDPNAPIDAKNTLRLALLKNKRGERWAVTCNFTHSGRIVEMDSEVADGTY